MYPIPVPGRFGQNKSRNLVIFYYSVEGSEILDILLLAWCKFLYPPANRDSMAFMKKLSNPAKQSEAMNVNQIHLDNILLALYLVGTSLFQHKIRGPNKM